TTDGLTQPEGLPVRSHTGVEESRGAGRRYPGKKLKEASTLGPFSPLTPALPVEGRGSHEVEPVIRYRPPAPGPGDKTVAADRGWRCPRSATRHRRWGRPGASPNPAGSGWLPRGSCGRLRQRNTHAPNARAERRIERLPARGARAHR